MKRKEFLVKGKSETDARIKLRKQIEVYASDRNFRYVKPPEATNKYTGDWRAYARIEME